MSELVEAAAAEAASEAISDIAASAGAVAAEAAREAAEREQSIIDRAAQAARDSKTDEEKQWESRLTMCENALQAAQGQILTCEERLTTLETPTAPEVVIVPSPPEPLVVENAPNPLPKSNPEENPLGGEGVLPEAVIPDSPPKAGRRQVKNWF